MSIDSNDPKEECKQDGLIQQYQKPKMTAKDKRKRFMVRKVAKVLDENDDESFEKNSNVDLSD